MALVSYALREDPNTILLLQDAGRCYEKYCQITTFGRSLVRPEFFQQYLYFAPYFSSNGKYRGSATNVRMSIEDNGYEPALNYVAAIDSEVEFRISSTVIWNLCKEHMPAWGVKSYLDYYSDRTEGVLLFLRVYRINRSIPLSYIEKGVRGSSQILKLYNKNDEEVSLAIDGLEPVVSDNKFTYIKDEIIHLLKVENAFIALYENTEDGLKSLKARIDADKQIKGTHQRWEDSHSDWLEQEYSVDDDFDMAQLDYGAIFHEILEICPGMKTIIDYARNIQAARLGEYDFFLKDVHNHTENEKAASIRLFDMCFRSALKNALNYHKRFGCELEDAFQESCIGIWIAIQKHSENVEGLFASYASMWMRQTLSRSMQPFNYNVRNPIHYDIKLRNVISQLGLSIDIIKDLPYNDLYSCLLKDTDCDEKEVPRIAYILSPAISIEEIIEDYNRECFLLRNDFDIDEDIIKEEDKDYLWNALQTLKEREREIIIKRFGLNGWPKMTLDEIGNSLGVTRERIRQIESTAKRKLCRELLRKHFISFGNHRVNYYNGFEGFFSKGNSRYVMIDGNGYRLIGI